jgi:hypothetical protein
MPGIPDMPRVPGMGIPGIPDMKMPSGEKHGSAPVMLILVVLLGLGTLVFGAMALIASQQAASATRTLSSQVAAAVAKASADQKKADDDATTKANESPYRSYVAPVSDGSFEIKFPKTWGAVVDEEPGGTQVSLTLNPDFFRKANGKDELVAAKVTLQEHDSTSFLGSYQNDVKSGRLHQNTTTISGQRAYDLTGTFSDKRTSHMVVVPVRDKVIVFVNENSKYSDEFNQILAQARIIP